MRTWKLFYTHKVSLSLSYWQYLRICDMEETLALYELVIDRIRDGKHAYYPWPFTVFYCHYKYETRTQWKQTSNVLGEDVDLARRTIKHIVDGNDHLLQYEIEAQKETTFPIVYLPGTSSIQVSLPLKILYYYAYVCVGEREREATHALQWSLHCSLFSGLAIYMPEERLETATILLESIFEW